MKPGVPTISVPSRKSFLVLFFQKRTPCFPLLLVDTLGGIRLMSDPRMSSTPTLHWLPEAQEWRPALAAFRNGASRSWEEAVRLAGHKLDFVKTAALDQAVLAAFPVPPAGLVAPPIRLAILGSATMTHLQPSLRVAALRRGMHVTVYENDYGQYLQELHDSGSALHRFKPDTILFALDAFHLTAGIDASMTEAEAEAAFQGMRERVLGCWSLARGMGARVLHQTPLPVIPELIGSNEQRLPGSRAAPDCAAQCRPAADGGRGGSGAGGARCPGRRAMGCWGGTIRHCGTAPSRRFRLPQRRSMANSWRASWPRLSGDPPSAWSWISTTRCGAGSSGDDGMEGIVLGQGSALGEAFASVQDYAREQSRRGVILAVCSKNDEANALEPFEKHPEMVLRRTDIAAFVANWSDKATNLREIARQLNIGLDSLVFLDDNPFERNLVRAELPMVAVPGGSG